MQRAFRTSMPRNCARGIAFGAARGRGGYARRQWCAAACSDIFRPPRRLPSATLGRGSNLPEPGRRRDMVKTAVILVGSLVVLCACGTAPRQRVAYDKAGVSEADRKKDEGQCSTAAITPSRSDVTLGM